MGRDVCGLRWIVFVALTACGGLDGPTDAATRDAGAREDGGPDAAATICERHEDCDDGRFCNGEERCEPGAAGGDPRGCRAGAAACDVGTVCDEDADSCDACTEENRDRDGDNEWSEACGGDDCNDDDPGVRPGAAEICDMAGVDEDCRPDTYGPIGPTGIDGDADGDSFRSAGCCQLQSGGAVLCGNDCNDANAEINPDASEICNGIDDNCDGMLDPVLEDRDGDSWAGCADLPAELRDCDDANAATHPGASELCDGEDNDCDGSAAGEDLDGDLHLAIGVTCTGGPRDALPRTDCNDGDSGISPVAAELCDTVDQDCDGPTDEAPAADSCPSDSITTYACSSQTCVVASCAATHADCDGSDANGCEQSLSAREHCGACGNACQWTCETGPACDDPVAITVGASHACSRTSQGRIRCWGRNDDGQVGLGSVSTAPETRPAGYVQAFAVPAGVISLFNVEEVEAGANFNCARVASGNLYCWGMNDHGQLGTGSPGASDGLARAYISSVDSVALGHTHGCVIRRAAGTVVAGSVWCWGDNAYAQAGALPTTSASPLREVYRGGSPAVEVVAGARHSCLRTMLGEVQCWGANDQGQLGQGFASATTYASPLRVRNEADTGYLSGAVEIRASREFTCARLSSGRVVCWGTTGTLPRPVVDTAGTTGSPVSFTSFVGGENTSDADVCGLETSGAAHCIGPLTVGGVLYFHDGSAWPGSTPVDIAAHVDGSGTTTLACVLRSTGLECLGLNTYGEVGIGTRSPATMFTPVVPPVP